MSAKSAAQIIPMEAYAFQNVYVIATYRCNWQCAFCLFRFNREAEAGISTVLARLDYAAAHSMRRLYLKITGGEPFMRPKLLEAIAGWCEAHKSNVYKIGIGTNGSLPIPQSFSTLSVRTHIFLSRHAIKDTLPHADDLATFHNSCVDFRLNCNLIKGAVATVDDVEQYIVARAEEGYRHICFRELSKVEVNDQLIYGAEVYRYSDYYRHNLVRVGDLLPLLLARPLFAHSRTTGNTYDTNIWFWYDWHGTPISVKFRTIDEAALIRFNTTHNGVDEFVVHPDGTLTGCWDKRIKVIIRGGTMPSRPYIAQGTVPSTKPKTQRRPKR